MSCILAYKDDNGDVYMAADGRWTCNQGICRDKEAKIFKVYDMTVGFAGNLRELNIIKHDLTIPEKCDDDDKYMFLVANAIRESLERNKFIRLDDNNIPRQESELLIYRNGRLYIMGGYFEISELKDGVSGVAYCDEAIGYFSGSTEPIEPRLLSALEVAATHNSSVGEPFEVRKLT
jgi:ATP-dependent protease HslVU (ClpYQ) peptidase subunit